MRNKTVVKAKADARDSKANLEHNAEREKKADATRIIVSDADTVAGSDSARTIGDAKAGTEAARDTVESIFGFNAGIIWNALNLNGSMTIDDLLKATTLDQEEIYGALGWLGRENKISLETKGAVRFFSLRS
jgi:hypothetical protein